MLPRRLWYVALGYRHSAQSVVAEHALWHFSRGQHKDGVGLSASVLAGLRFQIAIQALDPACESAPSVLNIKQPSVSKIEKQADMYLSTLRNYIEAVGGEPEMVVKLPTRPPIRLYELGCLGHISRHQS